MTTPVDEPPAPTVHRSADDDADRSADVPTLIALCDHLIDAVRPINPLSAYCLALGRDVLITWSVSGGARNVPGMR